MSGSLANLHKGLKSYYALHNIEYQNIKQTKWDPYADDNGLEEDVIKQELEDLTLAPTDALVVDFDPNFPLDDNVDITDDDARAAGILKILRYCFTNGSASAPYKTNLHKGLKAYYALHSIEYQNIKQTKWDTYVDDNGLEEDVIKQELEDLTLAPTDALVVDFDPDFPLDDDVDTTDDDARAAEILKILRYCFTNGSAPLPYKTAMKVYIDDNKVTTSVVTKAKIKLQVQAPDIYSQLSGEPALMYFLAVRDVNDNYPYLENMVQSYSRYRLDHYIATKQVLSIEDYICNAKGTSYMNSLKKKYNYQPAKYDRNNIVYRLKCAMSSYVKRVCPELRFDSIKRIDDNIIDISNYILSASELVKQIIDGEKCTPPFQIDLLIVVTNVINLSDPLDDGDDDGDDSNDDINDDNDIKSDDIDIDIPYFNQIENRLNSSKLAFVLKMMSKTFDNVDDDNKDNDNKDNDKDIDDAFTSSRSRKMLGHYKEFRDKLDKNHKKNKKNKNNKDKDKTHKPFNPATYPERKRFCILVDRKTDNTKDRVIFYEPPYVCDTMPDKHINEWYFESARTCLLPSSTFYDDYDKKSASPSNDQQIDDNKADVTIQANLAAQNKLLTFSFQIEQKDQIKCYMYWGGHVHRFNPVDIIKVFQFMFTDDQYNVLSTLSNKKLINDIMGAMCIKDAQFEQFYKSLDKSNQNIKFNKL